MENFYATKPYNREIMDPVTGKSAGIEHYTKATIIGNVLAKVDRETGDITVAVDNNITDRYERDYIGLNVQIEPGYDRFVQSADPVIQAQLLGANRGDQVYITGVVKGKGTNIRILTYKTLLAAPQPPAAVASPAISLVPALVADEVAA